MTIRDLVLHDVAPATLVYLPVLVDVLEAPDQPVYALADQVHAQAWLLQSLETRLADYAMARSATPLLLNALGAIGDLVTRLAEFQVELLAIDRPGILSGVQVRIGSDPADEGARAAALDELMPDEAEARRDTC